MAQAAVEARHPPAALVRRAERAAALARARARSERAAGQRAAARRELVPEPALRALALA
jgi:hypothetical protein